MKYKCYPTTIIFSINSKKKFSLCILNFKKYWVFLYFNYQFFIKIYLSNDDNLWKDQRFTHILSSVFGSIVNESSRKVMSIFDRNHLWHQRNVYLMYGDSWLYEERQLPCVHDSFFYHLVLFICHIQEIFPVQCFTFFPILMRDTFFPEKRQMHARDKTGCTRNSKDITFLYDFYLY